MRKLDVARHRYPDGGPDAVVHFASGHLQDSSTRQRAILDGERLLLAHPENRWILLAQGELLKQDGRAADASDAFRRILSLPNQEPDFLRRLFRAWSWMALAQMSAPHSPADARTYLQHIVDSGVSGDILADAKRMLDGLDRERVRQ